MHKHLIIIALIVFENLCLCTVSVPAEEMIHITIDPAQVKGPISKKIYSQTLEHSYPLVDAGLWGEMIRNRSFEEKQRRGFYLDQEYIVQDSDDRHRRLLFCQPRWGDYEFTLEAQKISGLEGFLVIFRAQDDQHIYWYNFGGWGNRQNAWEKIRGDISIPRIIRAPLVGYIERDRWYHIRVRCQGPHIQVWLDDQQLLDAVDDTEPYLNGRLGIGTWETQARFRNLKVTTLTGEVLFEGLPEIPTKRPYGSHLSANMPRYWQTYGLIHATASTNQPFNSRICLELNESRPRSGVQQGPLRIHTRQIYHGSLWARTTQPGIIIVRLTATEGLLDETTLHMDTVGQWTRYTFELTPQTGSNEAWLQIEPQETAPLWIDQVSLVPQTALHLDGFHPDLFRALAELHPPLLRWPEGEFVPKYAWQDGIGPQDQRPVSSRYVWDRGANSLGTDEFLILCRRLNAEPVICVNIDHVSSESEQPTKTYIQDTLDWLAYCNEPASSPWGQRRAANGHATPYGVRTWELVSDISPKDVYAYSKVVKEYATALKAKDPNVHIIADGHRGFDDDAVTWNHTLLKECGDVIDYINITYNPLSEAFATTPKDCTRFLQKMRPLLAEHTDGRVKLSIEDQNIFRLSWRAGLYVGGMMTVLEQNSDIVAIASPTTSIRYHRGHVDTDNTLININRTDWFAGSEYVVIKLFHDHMGDQCVAIQGDLGPLLASATKENEGPWLYIKTVNPSASPVAITVQMIPSFPVSQAHLWLVTADLEDRNSTTQPDCITPQYQRVNHQGQTLQWTLSPYSLSVVSVKRQVVSATSF